METHQPPPAITVARLIPGRHLICLFIWVAAFGLLYGGILRRLVAQWIADDNYSHGFLVAPLALYFVWGSRERLARVSPRPSPAGLTLIAASLGILASGVIGAEIFLTRISMLGVLAGTVVFLWGWAHLRMLAFPLSFLLLAIPLPAIVFDQIAFPLQVIASRAGEMALVATGVPVLREGNLLELPAITLEVADACSGVRSLVTLLTLAIVLAHLSEQRLSFKALLVLSAVPVAILANAARVAGTGLASHHWGASAAEGFLHTFSGSLVFVAALAGLLTVQRGLRRIWPWPGTDGAGWDQDDRGRAASSGRREPGDRGE